ncbi:RNA polymerase II subunit B1 CTD phosphatase RPAP2-like, partial [Homarus americanus]
NENLKVTSEVAKIAKTQAQKIFLNLIENTITPQAFIDQVRYIDSAVYDDVVTERAVIGLCGYPLCSKSFTDTFGDRVYIIRNNKVYDVTERRNYCSNVCFEASKIVRKQLATDPLYLRYSENTVIKDVKIPVSEHLEGLFGKLVDVTGGILNFEEEIGKKKKKPFTSVDEIALETLVLCSENEVKKDDSKEEESATNEKDINVQEDPQDTKKRIPETADSHSGSECERKVDRKEKVGKESEDPLASVYVVEQALREWMCFDSLRVVLGDNYVRGMLEHIGRTWDDFDTTSGLRLGIEAKAKYIAICRKLDHEEKEDSAELQSTDLENPQLRPNLPLPDYQQLQKDAKKQQLKVVSFLGGSEQYEESVSSQSETRGSLDSILEEGGSGVRGLSEGGNTQRPVQRKSKKANSKKNNEEVDIEGSTLPFIDNYSQVSWRQHIVEEKTSKFRQQILEVTDLDGREVRRLLKTLVATFDLSPHNITFKPRQWRLVTVILLKMLTVRYPVIMEALKGEQAANIQKTVLSGFDLDFEYCDRVLSYLTEIYYIISKNFKSKEGDQIQQNNDESEKVHETKRECNIDTRVHDSDTHLENIKSVSNQSTLFYDTRQESQTHVLENELENFSFKEQKPTDPAELD